MNMVVLKKNIKIISIFFILQLSFSCKGQEINVKINENIKFEIKRILFLKIDSTNYFDNGFGIVNNDYLINKPEIKVLIPEIDSLYDTLKKDIKNFIEKNKMNLPFNSGFNESLLNYFNYQNYNNLNFYNSGMVFTGFYFYQNDKEFVNIIEKFMDEFMIKINRHRPKLYFAIEKYINSSYVDELKHNTTFWHNYLYEKDGIYLNKSIIVYFFPNNLNDYRVLNINRLGY